MAQEKFIQDRLPDHASDHPGQHSHRKRLDASSSELAGYLSPTNVLTRKIQGIVDSIRRERTLEHESGEDVYPEIIPGELPIVETTVWQDPDFSGDWMDISNRQPFFKPQYDALPVQHHEQRRQMRRITRDGK